MWDNKYTVQTCIQFGTNGQNSNWQQLMISTFYYGKNTENRRKLGERFAKAECEYRNLLALSLHLMPSFNSQIYISTRNTAKALRKPMRKRIVTIRPWHTVLNNAQMCSRWLNDTGWVTAYAFDGVTGVTEITEGAVTQVDPSAFTGLARYWWSTDIYPLIQD